MALTELQQAKTILDQTQNLLIIVPDKASLDAVSSMISLYITLSDLDNSKSHHIDQVSPSHVPTPLQFLAGSSQIKTEPTEKPELVIDIVGPNSLDNVRTENLDSGMRLHLSFPSNTNLTKDQLETTVRLLPYDSIITIGALDLEELGKTFSKHADFFYHTPLINIDYRAANEHYGTVNLVDITAGSCAEATYSLIEHLSPHLTTDVSTALYAGIVSGTDSFQNPSTTPRSFQVAAHLIEQDADRESVIQNLVKTKPLKFIKLAGLVYAHLRYEEQVNLYWTTLSANDFRICEGSAKDVPAVMYELTNNIAGFNATFLLYEENIISSSSQPPARRSQSHKYQVYLLLGRGLKQRQSEIQSMLSAQKQNGALTFTITAPSFDNAERIAHEKIKEILP